MIRRTNASLYTLQSCDPLTCRPSTYSVQSASQFRRPATTVHRKLALCQCVLESQASQLPNEDGPSTGHPGTPLSHSQRIPFGLCCFEMKRSSIIVRLRKGGGGLLPSPHHQLDYPPLFAAIAYFL